MSSIDLTKLNIPSSSGCYLFKDKTGQVIYVGKAKNIKKRINWYFKEGLADLKTQELIKEIANVDFFVTSNEIEALLLEAKLIKQYQPKYNLKLRGGIRYAYIQITNEEFPRLVTTRQLKKGGKYFGPYTSGQSRQEAIRLANTLFKLRTCKKLPKKSCLLYHLKLCSAPCLRKITIEEYQKNVEKAEMFLKGKTKELIKKLEKEMKKYSANQQFELAKIRRDQILVLKNISARQRVQLQKRYNQDVINFIQTPRQILIQLFNINKGVISGRKEFRIRQGDLADFIKQYYYTEDIPQEIILPEKIADQNLIEKYLSKISKRKVKITVPKKGDKLKLLDLVKENLKVSLKRGESDLLDLQNKLSLPTFPRVIEAFDVSNIGGEAVVGSMIQFRDGEPDKTNYRRFKIKTFKGQSDFDALREIVFRRYYRLKNENAPLPDLLLIDGGRPQLSAALAALRELGLSLPVIALAKRLEEIFTLGNRYPLKLSKKSSALKLIQQIRNEAHRFALKYHRLLRGKKTLGKPR